MKFMDTFREGCLHAGLVEARGGRVVVGCSGGVDSQVLLHGLWVLRGELGVELAVLACDHGLRVGSAAEAAEVRHLAWRLGLPCRVVALRVLEARGVGESLEMAARRLRRGAYAAAAREFGASWVALGHHRDDQAETLLLRLCRGSGTAGAAGMEAKAPLGEGLWLSRPMLGLSRAAIEVQARRWGLRPMEDESNREGTPLRNRLRWEVLPLLRERVNPSASAHLAAFAGEMRRVEAWVKEEVEELRALCVEGGGVRLEAWQRGAELPRERLLRDLLVEGGGRGASISRAGLRGLAEGLREPGGGARFWDVAGIRVVVEAGWLRPHTVDEVPPRMVLPPAGELRWGGWRLGVEEVECLDKRAAAAGWREAEQAGHVRWPEEGGRLELRSPRRGDRYRPLGLGGSLKLSDLFINAKVPKTRRGGWPVVVCGEEVVWVPGFRVAEGWALGQGGGLLIRASHSPCHSYE